MLRVERTEARTVLSLPPEAPMATRSPGAKRWVEVMVVAISDSKRAVKQGAQSGGFVSWV